MTQENQSETKPNVVVSERILRWPEVKERTGICRSHAHNLGNQLDDNGKPKFPKPIKLGARASGWLESEINEWLQDRVRESR